MRRLFSVIAMSGWLAVTASLAFAGDQLDFVRQVLPLLEKHCVACHGPAQVEAQLNLALPTGIKRGGENGPAVSVR